MPEAKLLMFLTLVLSSGVTLVVALAVLRWWENRRQAARAGQPSSDPSAETLVLRSMQEAAAPPANFRDRLDHRFQLLMEGSGLGLDTTLGTLWIGLSACLGAAVGYLSWESVLGVALGLFAGALLPLLVFGYYARKQQENMQRQLPDVIFSLSRSLRANLSLEQAIAHVGEETPNALGREFRRIAEQMYLGLAAPAALESAARRIQLPDFNLLVALVSLHRTAGGNLPLLLDRLATSVRDRNQFRQYFRTVTAQARITAFAIALSVPVLFVGMWYWQPDYVGRFFQSSAGLSALAVAAILELVGLLWIYWILRVDY
ncbi:MAG: type II secretion system F family protein [Gemmatales bacterium]|nr:type II secretion system F family protein [Gemmatales bacterium]MDW8174473.1 type II secretion system F family protein [Gemmatales bacterium]